MQCWYIPAGQGVFASLGSSFIRFVGGMSFSSSFPPSLSFPVSSGLDKRICCNYKSGHFDEWISWQGTNRLNQIYKEEREREGGGWKKSEGERFEQEGGRGKEREREFKEREIERDREVDEKEKREREREVVRGREEIG